MSGIFTGKACAKSINHAMIAVGFGIENENEYVVIKNSWGTEWGENGYAKVLLRNDDVGVCNLY
jgi:C1A family cysteine protease